MPTRASKKNDEDATTIALRVAEKTIGEPLAPSKKNLHALALSRLGASKGGKARAEKLSKKRKIAIAKKAARVRWAKKQEAAEEGSRHQ